MNSYREHALDGASPVDLVVALYDGIIRFLYAAADAVDRGDIQVTMTKTPLAKVDAHTRNGDIVVAVPEKSEFTIDGSTSRGDGLNDFGDGVKQESNGPGATIKGREGNGPAITIQTDRGMITLKKS